MKALGELRVGKHRELEPRCLLERKLAPSRGMDANNIFDLVRKVLLIEEDIAGN